MLGLLIQAQIVVNHLLDGELSIPDLEASGLPFALAIAAPNDTPWFSRDLAQMPDFVRTLVVGSSLVVLAYLCAGAVLMVITRPWRLTRQWRRPQPSGRRAGHRRFVVVGAVIAVATAVSPVGALAVGVSNWTGLSSTPHRSSHRSVPGALGRLNGLLNSPGAAGPTRVQVEQRADGSWRYLVHGQPQVMRGVGYNPQYAALDPGERARLYQRDFAAMRELGINTIEGWFEPQFDQLTLDYAARNEVGVLMPFELNQDWPYENPNVQQSILDHVSAYVERYKNDPAVRMWAPGNENLHRILYPHLTNQSNDPAVRARAEAFAAFLPVLVDRIHALDPDHPVIYRDAEDVYLPTLAAAFRADGVATTVAGLWRQRLLVRSAAADRRGVAQSVARRSTGDLGVRAGRCRSRGAAGWFRAGLGHHSFTARRRPGRTGLHVGNQRTRATRPRVWPGRCAGGANRRRAGGAVRQLPRRP